jgi:CRP-like cAMP-binding protein
VLSHVAGVERRPQLLHAGLHAFTQGSPAESVFFLRDGIVKLSVSSSGGREAVVGILGPHDFFGEGCLAGQGLRMSTATAIAPCTVVQIPSRQMRRALTEHAGRAARKVIRYAARKVIQSEGGSFYVVPRSSLQREPAWAGERPPSTAQRHASRVPRMRRRIMPPPIDRGVSACDSSCLWS